MSEPQSVSSLPSAGSGRVRTAIAHAAERTGVDFEYLLAQARLESGLNPKARAATSSAAGLYQFTRGTWLDTLDKHGADHGLGWADAAIESGAARDPAMRAQIMALRNDPQAAALMAGELANDNRLALTATLGREPDASELYLAHFLGAGGANQFLRALAANPGQSAAALMPAPAAANRSIFHERNGAARSVSGVMDVIRAKVAGAMDGSTLPPPAGEGPGLGPVWLGQAMQGTPRPSRSAETAGPATSPSTPRASMAETLRDAFALNTTEASVPVHVRRAYGQLRAFGL